VFRSRYQFFPASVLHVVSEYSRYVNVPVTYVVGTLLLDDKLYFT